MAHIDLLTDATNTVDLASNDADTFAQIVDSFSQEIVELDQLGTYPRVWEEWRVNWNALNDVDRAEMMRILMVLKRQARQWANRNWFDPPVWREVRTPSETASRFAFVYDIQIPELTPQFYEPSSFSKPVLMRVLREGTWRYDDPALSVLSGDGGSVWISFAPVTVYDYQVGANTNYLTVTPPIFGRSPDSEMPTRFGLDYGVLDEVQDQNVIIARKSGELADLDLFNAHFNAVDCSFTPDPNISRVADANIAGGDRIDMTATAAAGEQFFLVWNIPAANLKAYQGSYLVYAQVNVIQNEGIGIRVLQGVTGDLQSNDPTTLTNLDPALGWRYVLLGQVSMPVYGPIPRGVPPAAGYTIQLRFFLQQNSDLQFGRFFIVPNDEGVFSVRDIRDGGGADGLVIDGDLRHSYPLDLVANEITNLPVVPNGRYLTTTHNKPTRFYFYKSGPPDNGYDEAYYGLSDTLITVRVIPMLKALRGIG